MNNLNPTLQMLFNQQLSEYREIQDLREKLCAAEARHQALADEIQRTLTGVPSEELDLGYDPPDWIPRNELREYADSVGMPLHEKIR